MIWMKPRKEPLTSEEEHAICKRCGGFCCKYYFFNAGNNDTSWNIHRYRKREILEYGKYKALILEDRCPYTNDEIQSCANYNDPNLPELCKRFPAVYRPFWNLRCELMRKRYARGMIPKDVEGFRKLKALCKPKPSLMKFYKEK